MTWTGIYNSGCSGHASHSLVGNPQKDQICFWVNNWVPEQIPEIITEKQKYPALNKLKFTLPSIPQKKLQTVKRSKKMFRMQRKSVIRNRPPKLLRW